MTEPKYRVIEKDAGWVVERYEHDMWGFMDLGMWGHKLQAIAALHDYLDRKAEAAMKAARRAKEATCFDEGGAVVPCFAGAGAMGVIAQAKPVGDITCPQWPTYACQCALDGRGSCVEPKEWR